MKNSINLMTDPPELPPSDTVRWTPRRKWGVVLAINRGELSPSAACAIYDLTPTELSRWIELLGAHGPRALRTTQLQQYRKPHQ